MSSQHQIQKIEHIAIVVPELETAIAFYRDTLKCNFEGTEKLEDRGIEVAFFLIGEIRIELISPLHENSEVSSFLEKRGGGLHHIAFAVDDVDASFQELKANNVTMIGDAPKAGAHACKVAFIHPKAGGQALLEITSPMKE